MKIELTDHTDEVLDEFQQAVLRALEECGLTGEGYAKLLCEGFKNPTGNLRNSITHLVDPEENAAYIGTNNEYAVYVELGTGKYYKGGRPGWWVYVEGSKSAPSKNKSPKIYTKEEALRIMYALRAKGLNAHITQGNRPHPFLKPALADHVENYRKIIEDELNG